MHTDKSNWIYYLISNRFGQPYFWVGLKSLQIFGQPNWFKITSNRFGQPCCFKITSNWFGQPSLWVALKSLWFGKLVTAKLSQSSFMLIHYVKIIQFISYFFIIKIDQVRFKVFINNIKLKLGSGLRYIHVLVLFKDGRVESCRTMMTCIPILST